MTSGICLRINSMGSCCVGVILVWHTDKSGPLTMMSPFSSWAGCSTKWSWSVSASVTSLPNTNAYVGFLEVHASVMFTGSHCGQHLLNCRRADGLQTLVDSQEKTTSCEVVDCILLASKNPSKQNKTNCPLFFPQNCFNLTWFQNLSSFLEEVRLRNCVKLQMWHFEGKIAIAKSCRRATNTSTLQVKIHTKFLIVRRCPFCNPVLDNLSFSNQKPIFF